MALQSSGAISLNDIHIEAGGTSGTQASINDADIRQMINKSSGATASFSEYYGASSSIATINCSLTLTRSEDGTYSTDYKGNSYFTLSGYSYYLRVADWSSLSTTNARNYLGSYSSTDTSVSSSDQNFLGSMGSGTTYDSIQFSHRTMTNTSNSVIGSATTINFSHIGNGNIYNYPTSTGSNWSLPTTFNNINLTFSYGGTNYNWNWNRVNHFSNVATTNITISGFQTFDGNPQTISSVYAIPSSAGAGNFIGAGNSTAITITGAKFTIT
mgnify:CR=1 FL=1